MKLAACLQCSKGFITYNAWIRKGGGKYCSTRCMGDARKGRPSYIRTQEHKEKMSVAISQLDLSVQAKNIASYNSAKKGKTLEEIYGDRAKIIRPKYTKYGSDNSNWKGGKHRQRYPYTFYRLRAEVLERDNLACMKCSMTDDDARDKDRLNRGLTVHHIDYDKENNSMDNLLTLCKWCNSSANGNRKEWQDWATTLCLV